MWRQDAVQINVPRIAAPSAERLVNLMSHFYQDTESEIKACAYPPPHFTIFKTWMQARINDIFQICTVSTRTYCSLSAAWKKILFLQSPSKWTLFSRVGSAVDDASINYCYKLRESTCSLFPINLLVPSSLFFQRFHDGGSVWSDGPSIPRLPPC